MRQLQFIPVPQSGIDKMSVSELGRYRESLLSLKDDVSDDEQMRYVAPAVSEEIKRVEMEVMWKNYNGCISELN